MTCPTPIQIKPKNGSLKRYQLVPCGRCYACLENKRQDWIIRLKEELLDHEKACFITLTYEDDNIEYNENGFPSVWKSTIQAWIARIRKKHKIRYYVVGEYGSKTKRPHYHAIIFGLDVSDYEFIESCWTLTENKRNTGILIGNIKVDNINLARIGYITKYHTLKNNEPFGSNKEFTLMSKKPPLGIGYVKRNKLYKYENINKAYYQDFEYKKTLPRIYKDKIYNETKLNMLKGKNERLYKSKEIEIAKDEEKENYFVLEKQSRERKNREFKVKNNLNRKL